MATPISNSVPLLTGHNNNNGTLTDEFISGLVQGGSWTFGGGPRTITYALTGNFDGVSRGWDASWIQAVDGAFAAWEAVANVNFARLGAPGVQEQNLSGADIALALAPGAGGGFFVALGIFPDPVFADLFLAEAGYSRSGGPFPWPRPEGDITFDTDSGVLRGLRPGLAGFEIVLHEIGHALGLKHSDDDGANGRPTFASLGVAGYGDPGHTLMYSGPSSGNVHLATPGLLDILAIQHIYGANMSYHTGNDTYMIGARVYQTIWDAGGIDTLSAASLPETEVRVIIDLRDGRFSAGTTAIAYNVTIEHAIGSAWGDVITGNGAANRLVGNGSNDTLEGGAGADTLIGGAQSDTYIIKGNGDVVVEDDPAGGAGDLVRAFVSYALSEHIEKLELAGSGDINGTGNETANELTGNAGDNVLTGGGGADRLEGGGGSDTLRGGAGQDVYHADGQDVIVEAAGEGVDVQFARQSAVIAENVEILRLAGGAGNLSGTGNSADNDIHGNDGRNLLRGGAGDDRLFGDLPEFRDRSADDTLRGGAGNDTLEGSGGEDHLFGDAGDDYLDGGDGHDTLAGGAGNDTLESAGAHWISGGAGINLIVGGDDDDLYLLIDGTNRVVEGADEGMDTIHSAASRVLDANVEHLVLEDGETTGFYQGIGNALDNFIYGNSYENRLSGGAGNDTIHGGSHDDTVLGGAGNDLLHGDGPTVFVNNDVLDGGAGSDTLYGGHGQDSVAGGTGHDLLDGGWGYDTLDGGAGADFLDGKEEDDTLVWGAGDTVHGGAGEDRLLLRGGDLNLVLLANDRILDIETINMGAGAATLTLGEADILAMSSTDTLRIVGDANDTVEINGAFVAGDVAGGFRTYTVGAATLLIDTQITAVA
jgi:serralysin